MACRKYKLSMQAWIKTYETESSPVMVVLPGFTYTTRKTGLHDAFAVLSALVIDIQARIYIGIPARIDCMSWYVKTHNHPGGARGVCVCWVTHLVVLSLEHNICVVDSDVLRKLTVQLHRLGTTRTQAESRKGQDYA